MIIWSSLRLDEAGRSRECLLGTVSSMSRSASTLRDEAIVLELGWLLRLTWNYACGQSIMTGSPDKAGLQGSCMFMLKRLHATVEVPT